MEVKIGAVDDFFKKVDVAALRLEDELAVGDTVHIKGHTTDFSQKIESMQIEHQSVEKAKKGDSIGIKVVQPVRRGDTVYKVTP